MDFDGSYVVECDFSRGWRIELVSQWDALKAKFAALAYVSRAGVAWQRVTEQPLMADQADDAREMAIRAANAYIDHFRLAAPAA